MSFLKSVLSIALLQFSFHVAEAAPLPAYSVIGDLFFNFSPPNRLSPNDFGSFALSDPRFGSVSLNSVGTPAPSVAARADIGPNTIPSIFGRASEIVEYALQIIGPTGLVPVRIDVTGAASGFATSGASFAVESRWDLLDGGSPLVGDDIRSGQLTGSFNDSFSRTVDILLTANHVYSVFMLADAAGAATLEGSRATVNAFIDPIFSFGLGVDTQVFSFIFSEGIGNSRAVPEPGTLALLLGGLLTCGLLVRPRIAKTQYSMRMDPANEDDIQALNLFAVQSLH